MVTSFRDRVAAYLQARPGQWVDGLALQAIGGSYAWRTRLSECRTQLGMRIENQIRWLEASEGRGYRVSEYRYVPEVTSEKSSEKIPGVSDDSRLDFS